MTAVGRRPGPSPVIAAVALRAYSAEQLCGEHRDVLGALRQHEAAHGRGAAAGAAAAARRRRGQDAEAVYAAELGAVARELEAANGVLRPQLDTLVRRHYGDGVATGDDAEAAGSAAGARGGRRLRQGDLRKMLGAGLADGDSARAGRGRGRGRGGGNGGAGADGGEGGRRALQLRQAGADADEAEPVSVPELLEVSGAWG